MAKNKQEQIRVQIVATQREKFYLEDINAKEAENIGQDDLEFKVELAIGSNVENEQLKVSVAIDAFKKEDKTQLFGIHSGCIFYSPDFEKLADKEGNIIAPIDFVRKLMNISIGGTRGMLSILLANSSLAHITLPLLDLGDLEKQK